MTRQQKLENEGWVRQFITDEPRLSEAVEEYKKLGFEVLIEPIEPSETGGECTSCLMTDGARYKVIFTRRKN
jgi:hypothetical protein